MRGLAIPLAIRLGAGGSVASDLAILSLAVVIGLGIGAISARGIRLGMSGVLFSALLFGQFGLSIEPGARVFLSNFALIVFMYAMGLEVGPGFGASLRSRGLRLNLLACGVLVLGAGMTLALGPLLPRATTPGLFSGAFTTTAGLAAAQETLRPPLRSNAPPEQHARDRELAAARAGLAYSIAYPMGIVGPMLVIVLLRRMFRVQIEAERRALAAEEERIHPHIETIDFEVTAAAVAGRSLQSLVEHPLLHPLLADKVVVFSRLLRGALVAVPTSETEVRVGDIYRAVGPHGRLQEVVAAMGRPTVTADFSHAHGDVQKLELVVTRTHVLHRSLHELDVFHRTGVVISHVNRAGVDLVPSASFKLMFADHVTAVGPKAGLELVAAELGNSSELANRSQLVPIFVGIVLGVVVGSIPLAIPGLGGGLRLGLAGGSLLAAIGLSRLGSVGAIVWYMPSAANQLFRNFGLAVFLACVGLQAGDHFIQRAATSAGLSVFVWGVLITMLPVFAVACFARAALKMNFIALSGWVAGAMGSSTSLLFAEEMTTSNAPSLTYAAVAPLANLVPIVCAQVLAILSVRG